jgi:excisionase family DNA binding protein
MTTIDEVLTRAVKDAVRESLEELRPVLAAAPPTAPTAGLPTYVTVKEAARIMSAHPVTVRRLIGEGKLGRYSVEGQLRVKVTDIHAYMARSGQGSPTIDLDERAKQLLARTKGTG